MLDRLLDWFVDLPTWAVVTMMAGIIAILSCLIVAASMVAGEDCESDGGEMVESGYTTIFVQSGNAYIPVTSTNYRCDYD